MVIKSLSVIGAGQMGSGIAQVAILSNLQVILLDQNEDLLHKSLENIKNNLLRNIEKARLTKEEVENALNMLTITTDMGKLTHNPDIVIEAVIENMDIKKEVFSTLDRLCPNHTILASNTSSLSITEIASVTERPQKVIGMHFMNPVPLMKLVEIIRGLATSDEVYNAVRSLSLKMGKSPHEVNDFPGFVSNRVLMPMINEAIYCLYEGIASIESIDSIMKLGMNHPMGPLALADLIGLDTCLYIMETLYEGFKDSKYRPCPLLKKYVVAGWLGKKSGKGFYSYKK